MTLNFAHRGASGYYPENTMLAFEKAIAMGCDGIETDIHLTRDGIPVLCHDEQIDRTTDGAGFIKDYTYQELLPFDFGIKYGAEFKGQRIPSLDEFLNLAKITGISVNLELKNNRLEYDNLEKIVIDKVYEYQMQERTIISSFNHYSIMKCKELEQNIKLGFLYDNPLYQPGEYGKYAGIYALHPNYLTLNDEVIANIKNAGLAIHAYTVNSETAMQRLIACQIDIIITNYPDKLDCLTTMIKQREERKFQL